MKTPICRQFRFRLKTLLAVVAGLCVVLFVKVYQVERMRAAVELIHQLGGRVGMSNECNEYGEAIYGPFVRTDESAFDAIKRRVENSDYFRSVYAVDLSRASISNEDIQLLQKFPNLRYVVLNETEVNDAALSHLFPIGTLRKIELKSTNVTEHGIERLVSNIPEVKVDWKPERSVIDDILHAVGDEFGGWQTSTPNLEIIVDP